MAKLILDKPSKIFTIAKMKLFLDPKKPLYTCIEKACENCDMKQYLNCHFNIKQLLKFFMVAFPVFIIAGIAIYSFKPLLLLPWLLFFISYFSLVEIRVMCSHCPHYAEPETEILKCWANYGSPKLWKYRPGPMSKGEKIIFFSGLSLIFIYPYPFLLLSKNIIMLILYSIAAMTGLSLLHKFLCVQCINFACPFNRVNDEIRKKFLEHNPEIESAWSKIKL